MDGAGGDSAFTAPALHRCISRRLGSRLRHHAVKRPHDDLAERDHPSRHFLGLREMKKKLARPERFELPTSGFVGRPASAVFSLFCFSIPYHGVWEKTRQNTAQLPVSPTQVHWISQNLMPQSRLRRRARAPTPANALSVPQ